MKKLTSYVLSVTMVGGVVLGSALNSSNAFAQRERRVENRAELRRAMERVEEVNRAREAGRTREASRMFEENLARLPETTKREILSRTNSNPFNSQAETRELLNEMGVEAESGYRNLFRNVYKGVVLLGTRGARPALLTGIKETIKSKPAFEITLNNGQKVAVLASMLPAEIRDLATQAFNRPTRRGTTTVRNQAKLAELKRALERVEDEDIRAIITTGIRDVEMKISLRLRLQALNELVERLSRNVSCATAV